jgi:hypothetical protein
MDSPDEKLEKGGYEVTEGPKDSKTSRKLEPARRSEIYRRNAAKSTGPKSPEGKTTVGQNAIKHGILAVNALLPDEDPQDFENLLQGLLKDLHPSGWMESQLVDRMAHILWRLRRLAKAEAVIFQAHITSEWDSGNLKLQKDPAWGIGRAFLVSRSSDALRILTRYEVTLDQSFYRAFHELQRLQAARAGEAVPPPIAVDFTSGVSADDNPSPTEELRGAKPDLQPEALLPNKANTA